MPGRRAERSRWRWSQRAGGRAGAAPGTAGEQRRRYQLVAYGAHETNREHSYFLRAPGSADAAACRSAADRADAAPEANRSAEARIGADQVHARGRRRGTDSEAG